jgi:hypothetical protein
MVQQMVLEDVGVVTLVEINPEWYWPDNECRNCRGYANTAAQVRGRNILVPCHEECFESERVRLQITSLSKVLRA